MTKKIIAIFLPTLGGGGAERVMVTLANSFVRKGFAVHLVLASAVGPQLENVQAGVRVVDLKAGRVSRAIWPLIRYLQRERPVAMLSAMGHANVIAIIACILAGRKTRIVVSERDMLTGDSSVRPGLVQRLILIGIKRLYPRADGICTVSDGVTENLRQIIGLRSIDIRTIYNPFDLEKIEIRSREKSTDDWLVDDGAPIILAVGRLTYQKDFSLLIQAVIKIRKKRRVRLIILGEGELRDVLESQARRGGLGPQDIKMPGFVSNPFLYMARCAVFVLSSRHEGLPGVLIEALACGAPVVSTDCLSGPNEILEGGRWGQLVPVGDSEAMSRAIENVLDTPVTSLPNVRRRAQTFALEPAVDAYLSILGIREWGG